jgi:hypothetical protein
MRWVEVRLKIAQCVYGCNVRLTRKRFPMKYWIHENTCLKKVLTLAEFIDELGR